MAIRHNAHNPRYVKSTRAVLGLLLGFGVLAPVVAFPAGAAHADAPAVAVTGLRLGATGDGVRKVQQALIDHGYSVPGGADGVFGAGTETALKSFQTAQGLTANGTVTAATAIALGLTTSPYFGLKAGDRGDGVRKLQEALIAKGITVAGGADGIFGPGTTEAVKQFQRNVGYYPSGVVNAATAAALATSAGQQTPSGDTGGTAEPGGAATAGSGAERGDEPTTAEPGTLELVGLKIGSRGAAVKELQKLLAKAGVEVVGGADGMFGALTQKALKSFQEARGLTASGKVDQATVDALRGGSGGSGIVSNPGTSSDEIRGLKLGDTGPGVKRVQEALIKMGYTVRGGADGVFGRDTQTAIKAFQTSNGFEPTGTITEATARALETVMGTSGGDDDGGATANNNLIGLKAGAVGADVKSLQEKLIAAGVEVRGGADGIFGPATATALKKFQKSQGLPETGVVDAATAAALADPRPVSDGGGSTGEVGFPEYGEKGARVIALQTALVRAGISLRGGVDGDFGSGTVNAIMEFQRQKGLNVTGKVDQATADALGLTAAPAPVRNPGASSIQLDHFPTARPCGFADTWHFNRGGGRFHLGVDIIAPAGTPIYAVTDGKISKVYTDAPGSLSGNGVRLSQPDGTYFFYAHMTNLADGIELGVPVKAGDVIGYVGNTGNTGGVNHLHFEVHPQGGSAINPFPIVKAINAC